MSATDASDYVQGALPRGQLIARINESHTVPLTLLLAPAGSGKTTLLQQWQHQLAQHMPDARVVYVDIQPSDDDPIQCLRLFAERARAVLPAFDTSWFMPFDVSELPPSSVAEALFDALEQVAEPLFIIFDDFQHITNAETHSVLAYMAARPPRNVHLILSSRERPSFDLGYLRLNNKVLEIDGHDLRMCRDDIMLLNEHLGGLPLEDSALDHVMSITEGWMVGVKMALMGAMKAGVNTLENFHASQPEIMDYFGHVVLKKLPKDARALLLKSSLLERFNAPLCDLLLGIDHSAQLIDTLSRRELFIIPEPEKPGWFRYHALFKAFLLARIELDAPSDIAVVHREASNYFFRQGAYSQGLWHAQQSGDKDAFFQGLAKAFDYWLREGYANDMLRWAETLSDEEVVTRMDLAAPLIIMLTLSRRFFRARYYLDALGAQNDVVNQGRYGDKDALQFLDMHLQLFQHDTDFMEGANLSLLMESSGHRDVRAFALAMVAYHHLQHGRVDQALTCATQAREVLMQLGHHFIASYAGLIIALAHQQLGHIAEAVAFVTEHFYRSDKDSPSWSLWAVGMVVVLYDQNKLDEARQLCEDLLPVVSTASATEAIATVYQTLSRLHHLQGNKKSAERMLDKLLGILQLGNYERFVSMTLMERVRQAYVSGEWAQLDVIAERFSLSGWVAENLTKAHAPYSQHWERKGLAAVYWLLASGRQGEAETVLTLLRNVVNAAGIRTRASIMDANLLVLRSKTQEQDDQVRAVNMLITRYGLLNINQSVFDEAPGLSALMKTLWQDGALVLPEFYTELFSAVFCSLQTANPLDVDPASVLTPKEHTIFALLQNGLTNAQISEKTGTSVTTTKWHLKNIYSKLGVSNRTEAALRASPR